MVVAEQALSYLSLMLSLDPEAGKETQQAVSAAVQLTGQAV